MDIAKVFWSGRSQAVRLPKEYRFQTQEVRVCRRGTAIVLEPLYDNWDWLDDLTGKIDSDFVEAVNEQPEVQDRQSMRRLFT